LSKLYSGLIGCGPVRHIESIPKKKAAPLYEPGSQYDSSKKISRRAPCLQRL
jgi:hypothetical protein